MNYKKADSEKNRQELISELRELRKKCDSLSDSYNRSMEEKSLYEIALSKLNTFSIELLNMSPPENLEKMISKMIREITGAKAAVFSSYHPDEKTLNVQHVELESGLLERVLNLIGTQLKKIKAPVDDETYLLITKEIIGVRNTLNEASFGAISRPVSAAIQKLLHVDRFIGVVYMIEGRFYGTTLLAMTKGKPDPPRQILENIIYLAAVTLKRKKAEEEIRDSEERFRVLIEGAPDAIFLIDPDSRKILYANKAASTLLLKTNKEIVGLNQSELHLNTFPGNAGTEYQSFYGNTEFLGFSLPQENKIVRSDGKLVPVEISAQTVTYKSQRAIMSYFRDISERKQSELVRHQILSELQTLIDNIRQGVLLENESRNVQFVNEKFCELLGIKSPEEIMGLNCDELANRAKVLFADPENFLKTIEVRLADKKVVLSDVVELADGRVFERDYIPIQIDKTKSKNYWIFRDVTERKQAEQTLMESQSQISALLTAIPDMLFIQNPEGVYINYHAPLRVLLYSPPEYFLGKNMVEILPQEVAEGFKKVISEAIETGKVQNYEYTLLLNGKISHFESRTIVYASDKVLSLVRDITKRKEAELKIQTQIQELKKLNEDKNRFMSIMAHDLKSPFNSILGLLRLLSENLHRYDTEKIQKLINTVRYSSENFYQLLESLLLWARAQSGKMTFEPQMVNFSTICNEVVDEIKLNAEAKRITIRLLQGIEQEVFADKEMLKTILRNLVSNAVKFTNNSGEIEIGLKNDINYISIEVSDNGTGMSPQQVATLFDIVSPHKQKGTAGETGTGLGLLLCRELVEKHGGKIKVESKPQEGSRFIFTLPVKEP
jgi:PAS domain S-box-containing protein